MAKRYKEKERKKRQNTAQRYRKREYKEVDNKNIKNKSKKTNLKIMIILIILLVAIIGIGINQKWFNFNISSNEEKEITEEEKEADRIIKEISDKAKQQSIILESNLLNPEELTNEISSKLGTMSEGETQVIQIHYKLKSLDSGTIDIYYKINHIDLMKINVILDEKKIGNIEEYTDDNLLQKEVIGDNLSENVQEDFESKKAKLDADNKSVNVIITNTEIIINTSFDN